jgi:hypothetical protein
METPKLVVIEWDDAFAGPQSWITLDEYSPEHITPVTVGWLIPRFLDGYITTADSYLITSGVIQYYGIGHIPHGIVRSIKYLNDGEREEVAE